MDLLVKLQNSDRTFYASPDEPVLVAAERAGFALPYSCRDGICGTCKGRLVSGSVEQGPYADIALSESEREQGYFLLCCSTAVSDLVVEVIGEETAPDRPAVRLSCTVAALERRADEVMLLRLALDASTVFKFRAGQYADFILENGARRSFSMANAPAMTDIELHIRKVPGGSFTGFVFERLRKGDRLTLEGPRGAFYLRDDAARSAIFVASGTGFAPIKSILLDAFDRGVTTPMTLYWGARRRGDLYMLDLPMKWAQERPSFRFVPVLSETAADDAWRGRTGLVHRAVMADHPDLSGCDVYACGVAAMVEAARRDFIAECALPPERFFADIFLTASDRRR